MLKKRHAAALRKKTYKMNSIIPVRLFHNVVFAWLITTVVLILPLSADLPLRSFDSRIVGYGFAGLFQDPHRVPDCPTYVLPACDPQWLYCACGKPVYNVSAIPVDKSFLILGYRTTTYNWIRFSDKCYSSCLLPGFDPLPPRPNITEIRLSNIWVAPDDLPFPIGRFLVNVKKTVQQLRLREIYLPLITRDTFAGFSVLKSLTLERNRLSAIALDAMEAFVPTPGNILTSSVEEIGIGDNTLPHFDWSVFIPLADTIKRVSLMTSDVQQVYLSRLFTMRRIEFVDLGGNNLTTVDNRFLDCLTQSGWRPGLNLQYNPLCTSDIWCLCPSMFHLWDWLTKTPRITEAEPGVMVNWRNQDGVTCGNFSDTHQGYFHDRFKVDENGGSGKMYKNWDVQTLARWQLDSWNIIPKLTMSSKRFAVLCLIVLTDYSHYRTLAKLFLILI
ncbi:uncharacterized protein LOC129592904 [Paramacrobiotus metropolitanus]|uniref:uncharacterized protein LOC129592904 n=1 Tax=Paramacrobiotus metropolitanus TaxID=2943436 RepID=UPI002445D091|nr:uncharacterized protein LOC129592904 [Paramacrobiotus metropolitanus]